MRCFVAKRSCHGIKAFRVDLLADNAHVADLAPTKSAFIERAFAAPVIMAVAGDESDKFHRRRGKISTRRGSRSLNGNMIGRRPVIVPVSYVTVLL